MIGEPQNLHLAPTGADLADVVAEAHECEIVDGDLCFYIELDRNRPYEIDVLTDNLLASAEERYERLRRELQSLREETQDTAVGSYRAEIGSGRVEPFVL